MPRPKAALKQLAASRNASKRPSVVLDAVETGYQLLPLQTQNRRGSEFPRSDPGIQGTSETGHLIEGRTDVGRSTRQKPGLKLGNLPPLDSSSSWGHQPEGKYNEDDPNIPKLHNLNSPYYSELENGTGYLDFVPIPISTTQGVGNINEQMTASDKMTQAPFKPQPWYRSKSEKRDVGSNLTQNHQNRSRQQSYTSNLRGDSTRGWMESLKP